MKFKSILLDSCVYFRFVILIDNLFEININIDGFTYNIKIHDDVLYEYNQQPRLKIKYPKISPVPTPTKKYIIKPQKNEVEVYQKLINEDIYYVEQYLKLSGQLKKTPSVTDKHCLAIQMIRQETILVCSDDSDIHIIASELGIKTLTGSELVELFLINKIVTKEQVKLWFIKLKSIDDFQWSYKRLEERL